MQPLFTYAYIQEKIFTGKRKNSFDNCRYCQAIDVDAESAEFSILEFQISDSILTNTYSYPFVAKPVNQHTPVIANLPDSVSIKENTPIVAGSSIFKVKATDADSKDTGDGQVS